MVPFVKSPPAPGRARSPSASANGSPRPPSPPRSTARSSTSTASCRRRRTLLPSPHRQGPRGARRAAALQRPRHGPRGHAALPRHAARLRPDHRERLLLRHRLADADPRGGLPAHRSGDEEDRRGGRAVRALRAADRRRRGPWSRDLEQELQGRAHRRRAEASTRRSASIARASSSTCAAGRTSRTPARSARSSCCASPARTGRTTPAASSSSGSTAPRSSTRRTSTPTCTQVEEAKKRDHRVLGKQLKLFTISQLVGSGLILWMPKGATVRGILETFIKDELVKRGYQPVYTPHIGRLELYRTSGPLPVLPRRAVPADVLQPARPGCRYLAQYRLAAGELDDSAGTDAAVHGAGALRSSAATTTARTTEQAGARPSVRARTLLEAMHVELPEYHDGQRRRERGRGAARTGWRSRKATCSSR